MNDNNVKLYRGSLFFFNEEATLNEFRGAKEIDSSFFTFIKDGILAVEDGKVKETGEYSDLVKKYQGVELKDYSSCLITPGFIDTHMHVTQTGIVAAYG